MDNLNKAVFDPADEWIPLEKPVYKSELAIPSASDDSNTITNKKRNVRILSPVVTFQLIVLLLILIVSVVCKTFFVDVFELAKECYETEISASMFFDGEFKNLDYSGFFVKNNA